MKYVEIKQKLVPLFDNTVTPKQIIEEEGFKYISAGLNSNGNIHTGLTLDEEEQLLPLVIGISFKEAGFRKAVNEHYHNLSERIELKGRDIDASYNEDENGIKHPVNISDYLLSRMLINDRTVKTLFNTDIEKDEFLADFELVDLSDKLEKDKAKFDIERKSMIELAKLIGDENNLSVIKNILVVHYLKLEINVIDIEKYSALEAMQKLRELSEKHGKAFLNSAKDNSLKIRALVSESIALDVIRTKGDSFYYKETKVGGNIKDIVTYISSHEGLLTEIKEVTKSKKTEYSK